MSRRRLKLYEIIHYLLITICLPLILLDVYEITSAIIDTESYHFGNEMFWWHRSLGVYISWCILHILYWILAIFVSFLVKEWRRVVVLLLFLLLFIVITYIEVYVG